MVADADTVDVQLVQAVRGGVHTGPDRNRVQGELVAQQVGRALSGLSRLGLGRLDQRAASEASGVKGSVSQKAGSDQSLSPRSVQTLTCQVTRSPGAGSGPG